MQKFSYLLENKVQVLCSVLKLRGSVIYMKSKIVSHSVVCGSLQAHGLWPVRLLYPWARKLEWEAISFSRWSSQRFLKSQQSAPPHPPTKTSPISLNSSRRILHFHVLMSHQRPGPKIPRIQFQGSLEIQGCFLMLRTQTIIIAWLEKKVCEQLERLK